jgi:tripartite-type tricarboxylate transporter receptor subunit TctC
LSAVFASKPRRTPHPARLCFFRAESQSRQWADEPDVLVAHPKLPFSTAQELIAFAKANPGKLTHASPGIGSVQHLSMELLASTSGIALVHVPYKGLPSAVNDVMAGHVDCCSTVSAAPHH